MVPLVDMVGKVISFLVAAIGDEDLVVLVVVMLVGAGMIVAHMIDTTIWMAVDVVVDGEDLTTEETLLIGVGVEVTVVALKEFERGVIAEAAAAAAAVAAAVAEAGVGAGAGVVLIAEAGLAAVVVATVAALAAAVATAVAAAMTNMRGHNDSLINQIPLCLDMRGHKDSLISQIPLCLNMRGHKDSLINQIPQCLNLRLLLSQGCLLCPQAHVIMDLLELI